MSANVHRLLLQPARSLLHAAACTVLLGCFGLTLLRRHPTTEPIAFAWCGILLPLALGVTLATMLHEPMHRPAGWLLPDAGRRFWRAHAALLGVLAAGLGLIAHLADNCLPIVPLTAIAAAALSFTLPFEPGWRWAGSRVGGVLAAAGVAFVIWGAVPVRMRVLEHPWVCTAVALSLATLHFAVAFSATRRRQRALVPFTSHLSSILEPNVAALRTKEDLQRKRPSHLRWRRALDGGTVGFWIAAIRHEHFPRWRSSVAGCGLLIAFSVGMQVNRSGGVAEAVLKNLFGPVSGENSSLGAYPFYLAVLIMMQGLWAPRPGWLYPLPRERQARVTFAASFVQLAINFALLAAGMLALGGISAWRAGVSLSGRSVAAFLLSLSIVLPLVPLLQWCLLHLEVRRDRTMLLLGTALSIAPMMLWVPLGSVWASSLRSPPGVIVVVLAVAASQWAYFTALRRFYREGDLLQHGTSRRNFGLV